MTFNPSHIMPKIQEFTDKELVEYATILLSEHEIVSDTYNEKGKLSAYDYDISSHQYSTGDYCWKLVISNFEQWQDVRDFKDMMQELLHRFSKRQKINSGKELE